MATGEADGYLMIPAAPHPEEKARLATLRSYGLLDTEVDARFQLLVEQASAICGVPISLITLVDQDRQWFKAKVGVDVEETPREMAFCAHAILQDDLFEVEDTRLDERFHDNPLVTGPAQAVFYAGMPIRGIDGLPIGTVCAIDHVPRTLDQAQREALRTLARQAEVLLEVRQRARKTTKAAIPATPDPREGVQPTSPRARPAFLRASEPIGSVLGSAAWSDSAQVVAQSLSDYFQIPVNRCEGGPGDAGTARAVTMVQLDTALQVEVSLDLVVDVTFLRTFAGQLFGDPAGDGAQRAVLFETANIVMGAVKRAFEAEGFRPTTGLPRERTAPAAPRERSEAGGGWKEEIFEVGGGRISVSLDLRARANRTVSASQLTEGMVLASDVPDTSGRVLVARGTRLTSHLIERIATSGQPLTSAQPLTLLVGGASFV